jgi:hypothetical protein
MGCERGEVREPMARMVERLYLRLERLDLAVACVRRCVRPITSSL